MGLFDPERMAVYRLARQHNRAVHDLLRKANTRGYGDLVGQLRSSCTSIPANILEAAGEWRPGKRLNYLMIAKGSTWESWAHTDSLVDFGLVSPHAIDEARALQSEITALLITTIRRLDADLGRRKARRKRAAASEDAVARDTVNEPNGNPTPTPNAEPAPDQDQPAPIR